jgi:hypothetical protein
VRTRRLLAILVGILILFTLAGVASAAPTPTGGDGGGGVADPLVAPNTTASQRAANLARAVPLSQIPRPHTEAEARPYGAELYTTDANLLCTTAYNALSTDGRQFVLTAGHCTLPSSASTGQFFYPASTTGLIGDTGARSRRDSGGDFAAIRANRVVGTLVRKLRQPANGRIDTMTNADDPVLGQNVALYAGNSRKVIKGFVSQVDATVTWSDGVVTGNNYVVQVDLATEGCSMGGDSGSPVAAGLVIVGVHDGSSQDATNCFLFGTQIATAMTAFGLHSAPASAP